MRSEVRSTIGSFISGKKVDEIRAEDEKKATFAEKDPVASTILKKVYILYDKKYLNINTIFLWNRMIV